MKWVQRFWLIGTAVIFLLWLVEDTTAQSLVSGLVSGQVRNGTTGSLVSDNLAVELRVYDDSFTRTDTQSTMLDDDGRFQFQLDSIPTGLVYQVVVSFEGLEYSSDIGRFTGGQAALNLPVTVYDQTTRETAVTINQLLIAVALMGDQVRVSELYTFDNGETAVYAGQTGDPANGTARITLPANAQNPIFQRGLGGGNFIPANEVMEEIEDGWADTIPLRPGPGSLTLLVTYLLPESTNLSLAHPLPYAARAISLQLPDGLIPEGQWQQQPTQSTAAGVMTTYELVDLAAGEMLPLHLTGQPITSAAPTETNSAPWVIGGGLLILIAAVAARIILMKRRAAILPGGEGAAEI